MNVHELIERNRNGESIGLPSFCTANQHVLEATLGFAAENEALSDKLDVPLVGP